MIARHLQPSTACVEPSTHQSTLDGSDELELLLENVCSAASEGIRHLVPNTRLEGLALGGGYGRGEGGVLRESADHDQPYNDIEFFIFIRGHPRLNERRYGRGLHELAHRLTELAGIEVEFKVLSLAHLAQSETTMFYHDLVMGHRWIGGADPLPVVGASHRNASSIPQHEATRLLMNRCSGLLYAAERLQRDTFTSEDADFVGRNIAKAQLALGDAVLCALGRYHWSCVARHLTLQSLHTSMPWLPELITEHQAGVDFKLHPHRSTASREQLARHHAWITPLAEKVWLWVEFMRLGQVYASARDYARQPSTLCPETKPWKNRLINGRLSGLRGVLCDRYPRERLLRALPHLLWQRDLESARTELRSRSTTFAALVGDYMQLWNRFN